MVESQFVSSKLMLAIRKGDWAKAEEVISFTKRLLNYRTCEKVHLWQLNVNDDILHMPVRLGHIGIVELQLKTTHCHLNMAYELLGTPLHVAVKLNPPELAIRMCELLIEHGADVSLVGRHRQRTPLHAACSLSSSPRRLIELLVDCRTIHKKTWGDCRYILPHQSCVDSGNLTALEVLFEFEERNALSLSDDDVWKLTKACVSMCKWDMFKVFFTKFRHRIVDKERQTGELLEEVYESFRGEEWATFLLDAGSLPFLAMSQTIRYGSQRIRLHDFGVKDIKKLDLLFRYVTPEAVTRFNSVHHVQFRMHPVVSAADHSADVLRRILELGLDFSNLQNSLSYYDGREAENEGFFGAYDELDLRLHDHCKLLSHVLLSHEIVIEGDGFLTYKPGVLAVEEVINVLLEHGAPVNSEVCQELPPLSALALRAAVDTPPDNPFYRVLRTLIKHGANPFHMSVGQVRDTFKVPDALLISALVGNIPFLRFFMNRIGFDPVLLIESIMEHVCERRFNLARKEKRYLWERFSGVIQMVAAFAQNSEANNDAIETCFEFVHDHLLDSDVGSSGESVWEIVRLDSLQDMTRRAINAHLVKTVCQGDLLEDKIDRLPVPILIKRFILFERMSVV